MKKIKFAVIGCGNIAIRSSIPALMESERTEVTVLIDHNENKKSSLIEKFKVPFETNIDKAISNFEFDAVYIATPTGFHKDFIIHAARNNKHILCEKSLAIDYDEVISIVKECEEHDVALFEGFMYQFHSQHKFINKLIENGEIGESFHFDARFGFPPLPRGNFRYDKSKGGGAILDAGAYTVHAARHFFHEEPVKVSSSIFLDDNDVEIRGSALLEFNNGKTSHISFGFNNYYQNCYSIWGTHGTVNLERAFSLPPDFQSVVKLTNNNKEKNFLMNPCNHFIKEFDYFVENLSNSKIKKEWISEALNQARVLEMLRAN